MGRTYLGFSQHIRVRDAGVAGYLPGGVMRVEILQGVCLAVRLPGWVVGDAAVFGECSSKEGDGGDNLSELHGHCLLSVFSSGFLGGDWNLMRSALQKSWEDGMRHLLNTSSASTGTLIGNAINNITGGPLTTGMTVAAHLRPSERHEL